MASITSTGKNGWRITFYVNKQKRQFRFTGSKRTAKTIRHRVEDLVDAANHGRRPDEVTSGWLKSVQSSILDKLERTGILSPEDRPQETQRISLQSLVAEFDATRVQGNGKQSSRSRRTTGLKVILKVMGGERLVDQISEGDAFAAKESMIQDLCHSGATVSRNVRYARSLFAYAVSKGWIDSNPFQKVPAGSQVNKATHTFVEHDVIQKVVEHASTDQDKLLIYLARYGGVRCPSEGLKLRWRDIDWKRQRITIWSPKTEHIEGRESREIPLFPELVQPLKAVYGTGKPQDERVFTDFPEDTKNLTTRLRRIIKRSGVEQWPKAWQNLRKSRETELIREFGLTTATTWLGNSPEIALKHYDIVRQLDFDRATRLDSISLGTGTPAETDATESAGTRTDASAGEDSQRLLFEHGEDKHLCESASSSAA